MNSTDTCSIKIDVGPPVRKQFRTGSYLIHDYNPPKDSNNFRPGTKILDTPFRASGSHQLDVSGFVAVLQPIAKLAARLFLVDLREETHVFFDERPVSLYADKDFANVGQTPEWIVADEEAQVARITAIPETQIFCINEDSLSGIVTPTGYNEVVVASGVTEETVAANFPFPTKYIRLPVTDHCMPSQFAFDGFIQLCRTLRPNDWVHFHCHGGDGRTTTFLALFDMVNWFNAHGASTFPTIETFADRQCEIFSYCLNPNGCPNAGKCKAAATVDWKYDLAKDRWQFLDQVRTWIANGGLGGGQPFSIQQDWK